jgi:hypothetical protein
MLLRDQPRGMTADLSDFAVAFWNGHQVVYGFLRDDGSGLLDEEFDLADYVWEEWALTLTAWCSMPTFTARAEVLDWAQGHSAARFRHVTTPHPQTSVALFHRWNSA